MRQLFRVGALEVLFNLKISVFDFRFFFFHLMLPAAESGTDLSFRCPTDNGLGSCLDALVTVSAIRLRFNHFFPWLGWLLENASHCSVSLTGVVVKEALVKV